jgi:hypothetical protein
MAFIQISHLPIPVRLCSTSDNVICIGISSLTLAKIFPSSSFVLFLKGSSEDARKVTPLRHIISDRYDSSCLRRNQKQAAVS